jgi:ribosome-associated protein
MARRAAPHRGIDVHYGDAAEDTDEGEPSRPSKTALKQQAQDAQALGLALAALSDERLAKIDMPESLHQAITEYRRTKSHEGKRRQLQYVGKLMRQADESALREAVAAATVGSAKDTLALHVAEHWRAQLISSDDALTQWMLAHPDTDSQQLRSLVRQARRDAVGLAAEARQPKSHRELFQLIKPMLTEAELGA